MAMSYTFLCKHIPIFRSFVRSFVFGWGAPPPQTPPATAGHDHQKNLRGFAPQIFLVGPKFSLVRPFRRPAVRTRFSVPFRTRFDVPFRTRFDVHFELDLTFRFELDLTFRSKLN